MAPPPLVDGASRPRPILSWAGVALPAAAAASRDSVYAFLDYASQPSVDRSIVEGLQVYSPIAASNDAITNAVAKEFLPMFEDAITPMDWLWEPEITAEIDSQVQAPREGRQRPAVCRAGRRGRREGAPCLRPELLPLTGRRLDGASVDATGHEYSGPAMPDGLLQTKLYAPRPRGGLVHRPRLTERLDRGVATKLTLVSAPAGFGKTTALAEWLASAPDRRQHTAWLSLDGGDNQAAPFWAHVIAALRGVAPGIGERALAALESAEPSIEAVLAPLLNELSAVPDDIVLVLDDVHAIDAPQVLSGIEFLIDHLPANAHLVLATRADPALPLARLRVRGDLVEVRAADLRFSPAEAAAYLTDVVGLALTASDIAALEARTEGWIAAIQLAGLSMQGRDDISGFIAGFAGDDRYVVDYLMEEVLRRQPEDVRSFLLETSILARMTGPLCDAVTNRSRGNATLEALERGNLFLVPLDDRRRWYRYHHLFGDVLLARLLDERADEVPALHRRASDWFELHGERPEAIRHAMAGGDVARAADLIELAMPAMRQSRQEDALRRWLDALPDDVVSERPVLGAGYAGALLATGELEGVEELLQAVEAWLDGRPRRGRSSWTRRRSPSCRRGSPCTGPPWRECTATWPAPWPTRAAPSTSSPRTTTWAVAAPPPCSDSRTGRSGTSRPRTAGSPRAWPTSSRRATSPTSSAAP